MIAAAPTTAPACIKPPRNEIGTGFKMFGAQSPGR
jgi:hypothetical protein